MIRNILIIFLIIVVYKFLTNFIKYKKLKRYQKEYIDFLANKSVNPSLHKNEIMQLLKDANVKDVSSTISQPSGYGMIATYNASVMTNYPSIIVPLVKGMMELFDNGIGEYRKRYMEALSPLYWIDLIVFFPKYLLEYIKIDKEKYSFKILNIVLTFLYWLFMLLMTLTKDKIVDFVVGLLRATSG